jgi:hypothetical protein
MQQVLKTKSTMVVNSLIDMLSCKNQDDIHLTLNASTVLNEFCENESFFQILTQPDVMSHIVTVVTNMDANAMNQPYAMNFLTQIITQFCGEQDNSFFRDRKEQALDNILAYFNDICYNCIVILRAGGNNEYYVNQSG